MMSGVQSFQRSREGNHIAFAEPKLSGASGHAGKRLKEQVWWIGPVNSGGRAADMEKSALELELWNNLHEDCRFAHVRGLSTRGFGGKHDVGFRTLNKPVTAVSLDLIA